jgi:hypothetical protein
MENACVESGGGVKSSGVEGGGSVKKSLPLPQGEGETFSTFLQAQTVQAKQRVALAPCPGQPSTPAGVARTARHTRRTSPASRRRRERVPKNTAHSAMPVRGSSKPSEQAVEPFPPAGRRFHFPSQLHSDILAFSGLIRPHTG